MKRVVAVLLCSYALSSSAAERQIKIAYASCEVMNALSTGIQPDKWVSPVFEFSYIEGLSIHRIKGLATAFGEAVALQGGSGDTGCLTDTSRQALEQSLVETRQTLSRRFLGVASLVKYHDVAWTPAPWDAQLAMAAPSTEMQFIFCVAAKDHTTLATPIFAEVMSTDDVQHSAHVIRLSAEFKRDVAEVHLPGSNGACLDSNSQREAQQDRADRRSLSTGKEQFVDVNWKPAQRDAAARPLVAAAPEAKPLAPAVVASASVAPFKPVAIDPKSLGPPPVLRTVYGFCQHAGMASGAYRLFMTPVFEVANAGGEASLALGKRYAREFVLASDPQKKLKQAFNICHLAGSHAEIEVRRQDLLAAYALPAADGSGPGVVPVVTQWLPANALLAALPEGPPLSLHIVCGVLDPVAKKAWYTGMFMPAGADAAAQFEFVQRLHGDYRQYIVATQRTRTATAAACTASENPAFVDYMTATMAGAYAKQGYASLLVDWKSTEVH